MVGYVTLCGIKSGKMDAFVEEYKPLLERFRKQKGNRYYHIAVSPADDGIFMLTDGWDTQQDLDAHCASCADDWARLEEKYMDWCDAKTFSA